MIAAVTDKLAITTANAARVYLCANLFLRVALQGSYSVGKSISVKESSLDFKMVTPLAIGAAVSGVLGKSMFSAVKLLFIELFLF